MSPGDQLVLMIGGLHLLALMFAFALIVPALRDRPEPPRRPGDGSDGGGGQRLPPDPQPPSRPGGIPLPDAQPARVRLRERGRLADRIPGRPRRPAREPERQPSRIPQN
jgi:hypothetical protein